MKNRSTPSAGKRAARLCKSAQRLLASLAAGPVPSDGDDAAALLAADLATRRHDGTIGITAAGRAHLARRAFGRAGTVDPFIGQHLGVAEREIETAQDCTQVATRVAVDATESPLAWLARRKSRDGRPLIEPQQLQAGERLRADFTYAQIMPRVTANWTASVARSQHGGGAMHFSDAVVAARQRVRRALDTVGPEFSGLLIDICCFLKGLEDVERERGWPSRSAKVVLQLGLDRLARHYGLGSEARGPARTDVRTWLAPGAAFTIVD